MKRHLQNELSVSKCAAASKNTESTTTALGKVFVVVMVAMELAMITLGIIMSVLVVLVGTLVMTALAAVVGGSQWINSRRRRSSWHITPIVDISVDKVHSDSHVMKPEKT